MGYKRAKCHVRVNFRWVEGKLVVPEKFKGQSATFSNLGVTLQFLIIGDTVCSWGGNL